MNRLVQTLILAVGILLFTLQKPAGSSEDQMMLVRTGIICNDETVAMELATEFHVRGRERMMWLFALHRGRARNTTDPWRSHLKDSWCGFAKAVGARYTESGILGVEILHGPQLLSVAETYESPPTYTKEMRLKKGWGKYFVSLEDLPPNLDADILWDHAPAVQQLIIHELKKILMENGNISPVTPKAKEGETPGAER